jgi:2-succinyl-6-hydroxy-2,4-cyclohexadiene-1-carboxylate synthase
VPETIVLLHGFTQTGSSWSAIAGALRESYTPIAPDLRGHGSAANRRPVDLAAVLDDLAGAAPPRFALAGYSMGGRIALHLALAHPDRVTRLALIGASPGLAGAEERAERRAADERWAELLESQGIDAFADAWAAQPIMAGQPPEADAVRRAQSAAGLAAALRGLGTGALPSLWDRLGELAMPVTLIAGEHDAKFRAIAEQMAQRIPDARVAVIPGAGHAAHLEAPRRVAEQLKGVRSMVRSPRG